MGMTINQAITRTRALKKTQFDDDALIGWLSDLDGMIYSELTKWHASDEENVMPRYDQDTDTETKLLVPEPYTDLYVTYLAAQIEFAQGDFTRYNNSMVMYNMRLQQFANTYNRNTLPKQGHYIGI